MNVRTFNDRYKEKLFDTLDLRECKADNKTIWLSSRLYDNMVQDSEFDKHTLYFKNDDDEYLKYNVCVFNLTNNEKWLITSNTTAKDIAYFPDKKYVLYIDDKKLKKDIYKNKHINNWKEYIDYDDLGVFLLASNVSNTFLSTFFIFLMIFMIIAFSSLAKEFAASIFLTKLYGLNKYRTVVLYTFFFILYTIAIAISVFVEYSIISMLIYQVSGVDIVLNYEIFYLILKLLVGIGFVVSVIMMFKYHRLPL